MSKSITLTKLETAIRQIDTAIWLWFNGADIVSVVQLTGAAFDVLDDLFQHAKMGRPHPFTAESVPEAMKPREWRKLFKAAHVFAKHARRDPEHTQEYRDSFAAGFLFLTIAALHHYTQTYFHRTLRSIFNVWYGIHYPGSFTPRRESLGPEQRVKFERLEKLSRIEFFKETGGDFIGNPPRYKRCTD